MFLSQKALFQNISTLLYYKKSFQKKKSSYYKYPSISKSKSFTFIRGVSTYNRNQRVVLTLFSHYENGFFLTLYLLPLHTAMCIKNLTIYITSWRSQVSSDLAFSAFAVLKGLGTYPRSGYFLVNTNLWKNNEFSDTFFILEMDPFTKCLRAQNEISGFFETISQSRLLQ